MELTMNFSKRLGLEDFYFLFGALSKFAMPKDMTDDFDGKIIRIKNVTAENKKDILEVAKKPEFRLASYNFDTKESRRGNNNPIRIVEENFQVAFGNLDLCKPACEQIEQFLNDIKYTAKNVSQDVFIESFKVAFELEQISLGNVVAALLEKKAIDGNYHSLFRLFQKETDALKRRYDAFKGTHVNLVTLWTTYVRRFE